MHTMSFRVPAGLPEATAEDLLRSAVGGGHDRCPTPTRCHLRADQLTLNREVNESGPCYVPWDVPRAGRLMTPTTSLMVRDRQYQLGAELARGKINQVRNQYGEWEGGGLDPAPDVEALLTRATKSLAEAVLSPPGPASDRPADAALADAFEAADLLVRKYVDQVFRLRHQRQPRFDTAFGCRLTAPPVRGLDDAFRLSFNAACVPLTWRLIEPTESGYQWEQADAAIAWAADRNLPVYAGPLIDFSDAGFPDYVLNGDGDPITLKSLISDYVGTVAARYRGKVSRWLISSGANGSSVLGMSEEDLVRLTVMAADAAWQIDPNMQIVFGLSQPWGDYLAGPGYEYSPFVFADTLLRAGLPFAGIELEMFCGTAPRGSYCRDLLEASRMLDLFGMLGVPVQVSLAYPSSDLADPKGDPDERIEGAGQWRDFSIATQADWATAFTALAVCKSYVVGVFWDHLSDAEPHRIPNAGLVDALGAIKPAFDRLRSLREDHLK